VDKHARWWGSRKNVPLLVGRYARDKVTTRVRPNTDGETFHNLGVNNAIRKLVDEILGLEL